MPLSWITYAKGIGWALHYLDGFIIFGKPSLWDCHLVLDIGLRTCAELGWAGRLTKFKGPSTLLSHSARLPPGPMAQHNLAMLSFATVFH